MWMSCLVLSGTDEQTLNFSYFFVTILSVFGSRYEEQRFISAILYIKQMSMLNHEICHPDAPLYL